MLSDDNQEITEHVAASLRFSSYVLTFTHHNYYTHIGGVEKCVRTEEALFHQRGLSYIQVFPVDEQKECPDSKSTNQLVEVIIDTTYVGLFSTVQLGLILDHLRSKQGIWPAAIHLHHLMGFALQAINDLIDTVDCRIVRCFIHDFYTICPQFNLIRNGCQYCGAPELDSETCATCTSGSRRAAYFPPLKRFLTVLKPEVIIPSAPAKDIWETVYPGMGDKIRVVSHQVQQIKRQDQQTEFPSREESPIRIAFVGYQKAEKGWDVWHRLTKRLPEGSYELFHMGVAYDHLPNVTNVAVSYIADGDQAMTTALRTHRINIALLWSVWPETYSFTLFESLAADCFVLTNEESGNIAAVIREHPAWGKVFSNETELYSFLADSSEVRQRFDIFSLTLPSFTLLPNQTIINETIMNMMKNSKDTAGAKKEKSLREEGFLVATATQLLDQLRKRGSQIEQLQAEHAKKDQLIARQSHDIVVLQQEHTKKDLAIHELRQETQNLSNANHNLNQEIQNLHHEKHNLHNEIESRIRVPLVSPERVKQLKRIVRRYRDNT